MAAIPVHNTATDTDHSWVGPSEVAAAPNDAKVLRSMHAWQEDGADPNTKAAYKFPHHANGSDTPANIDGVNNALARLSQADIPAGDKAGVEEHLRAHRTDAGLEDRMSGKEITAAVRHIADVDDLTSHERSELVDVVHGQEGHPTWHPSNQRGAVPIEPLKSHAPIRCFDGNGKPYEPFWGLRNAVETGGDPELEFYGYISEYSWLGDEITPKKFKDDLYALGAGGPVTVRLNSGGGDVVAASVIRSIMSDYPGTITVRIDGLAASAAVIVAMAGQKVRIMDTAYMMIHDPAFVVFCAALDIETLGTWYNELVSIKRGIVDTYAGKTGLKPEKLGRMMADETWMSAQEAVDLGFADEVIKGGQAPAAGNTAIVNALHDYKNVPAALRARLDAAPPSEPVVNPSAEAVRLQAEVKMILKSKEA
jgi:ATP-dependent Clp protease protease subunit